MRKMHHVVGGNALSSAKEPEISVLDVDKEGSGKLAEELKKMPVMKALSPGFINKSQASPPTLRSLPPSLS